MKYFGKSAIFALAFIAAILSRPVSARADDASAGISPAAEDPCARLDALYPQPGRQGLAGENSFRPLPVLAPVRQAPGAPGTLSLSIDVDHVSQKAKGSPGVLFVGNYQVTEIPAFRLIRGAGTSFTVTDPRTGRAVTMPDSCVQSPSWGFAGSQWALVQGDTLDVLLHSRLDYKGPRAIEEPTNGAVPCRSSNLHTHGLLVSPYHPARPGLGPYGDYVLDVTEPPGSDDRGKDTDTCGTNLGDMSKHGHGLTTLPLHTVTQIPGQPGVNSLKSGEHPSGLFWYHPHPHGFSQPQVAGGTTGAITVGSLSDYACPPGGTPGTCSWDNANVRVLELKDTEIQSYGSGGLWSLMHDADSGLCDPVGGIRHGECQASESGNPGKWVFTINGVQYPTIRPGAGRMEVWRIVNASPNMTYLLSLRSDDGNQASLPFQLLAKDGVSIRQIGAKAALQTEIMMMPATRVEIAIPAPPGGGTYILHNAEIQTGGNGSGDIWPVMELGRVVWESTDPQDAKAASLDVAGPGLPPAAPAPDMNGVPRRCSFAPGDTRVVYFTHRFYKPAGGTAKEKQEIFGLVAGLRHADGSMDFFNSDDPKTVLHNIRDVWTAGTTGADHDFPAFGHNPWGNVCTVRGSVEPWELQNWTGEDHNFHIHQSRFTINRAGVFQYPKLESTDAAPLRLGDRLLRSFAKGPLTYNDTVPVPRGQSFCAEDPTLPGCKQRGKNDNLECTGEPGDVRCANPGIMSVTMDFSRDEQVGSFVYHCHILEHEDGGMMAGITVLCPPGDQSCAAQQLASAPICRSPELR